uniref:Uncharacterized protein n=1 Tax=Rousettus aegyptiacus TaxID=9407 RepID=A0A7J8INB0_ROUAE|nr:hypothetical protein HJG63_010589 [Rousettus aegyptiacus]
MAESEGNSQFEVGNLCGPALAGSLQNRQLWTTGRGNLLAAGPGQHPEVPANKAPPKGDQSRDPGGRWEALPHTFRTLDRLSSHDPCDPVYIFPNMTSCSTYGQIRHRGPKRLLLPPCNLHPLPNIYMAPVLCQALF